MLEGWPGKPCQRPPSPEEGQICNCETREPPGSSAWAGGTSWTSPSPHHLQSWTPPAGVQGESSRERSPRHWSPPVKTRRLFLSGVLTLSWGNPGKQSCVLRTFSRCMMEVFLGSLGSSRDCMAHSPIFFMSYNPDAPMYETASRWPGPLRCRNTQLLMCGEKSRGEIFSV